MTKSESKYFNTAKKIDEAFINLLDKKDFEYITVKEICQTAGVNRSTFYLHYETIDDLVYECNDYIVNKFTENVGGKKLLHNDIKKMQAEDLNFISPKYLMPWLEFVRKNKALFRIYINKFQTLTVEKNNKLLFNNILNPILDKFNVDETDRHYMIKFYIEGIMALVKFWIKNNCEEDITRICNLIIKCVYCEKN